jgi:hypothetical protein
LILENITREGVRAGIVVSTSEDKQPARHRPDQRNETDHIKDRILPSLTRTPKNFRAGDITVLWSRMNAGDHAAFGLLTTDGGLRWSQKCTMKMS